MRNLAILTALALVAACRPAPKPETVTKGAESPGAMLVGALTLAGCGGGGERTERSRDTGGMMGHMDSGGMGMAHMDSGNMGMRGMPMQGMHMMSNMRSHMDSMMRMTPQQMQAMMAI